MRILALFLLTLFINAPAFSQTDTTEYVQAYGKPGNPAIIFLHGGPGYNSAGFEFSTADTLAARGYFVVVYDQRASGRSGGFHPDGPFTLDAFVSDLYDIYARFGLKKAVLMGHSWGGVIATKFAGRHPEMVQALLFVDAPSSYPMTFRAMQDACAARYAAKGDTTALGYINVIRKMDTASLGYSSFTFMQAMNCGLYMPAHRSDAALALYQQSGERGGKWLRQMDSAPVNGLFKEEHYTSLNVLSEWHTLARKLPVYGIFGSEDGLFNTIQLDAIRKAIGKSHVYMIAGAGHNSFIDNQVEFLNIVGSLVKAQMITR